MKALPLLKHNIDYLLNLRQQSRRDLASWVRQSTDKKKIDPWISQIFTSPTREFQIKYLDRIADFFGLTVYQLFQPGLEGSTVAERRKAGERRTGRDRRVSHIMGQLRAALVPTSSQITEADVADFLRLRSLTAESRVEIRRQIDVLARSEREAVAPVPKRRVVDKREDATKPAASRGPRR